MMLYSFCIVIGNFVVDTYHSKELSQNLMSVMYTLRNFNSVVGESYSTVFFVVQVTAFIQSLDHFGHTRRTYIQIVGYIYHRSISFLPDKLINDFKVILHSISTLFFLSNICISNKFKSAIWNLRFAFHLAKILSLQIAT